MAGAGYVSSMIMNTRPTDLPCQENSVAANAGLGCMAASLTKEMAGEEDAQLPASNAWSVARQ
jgi:hypothetical protein